MFHEDELKRYARQIKTDSFSLEKQKKLSEAHVLVIGAGGLGSPILYYLAAVGVGNLGVVDFDKVDLTNLNRQILHSTDDLGRVKVESAMEKLQKLNPNIKVKGFNMKLDKDNIKSTIKDYDVIIDAVDNFATRYVISDACYQMNKPLVEGAAVGLDGIIMTIIPKKTPCYRCLYPDFDIDSQGKTVSAAEIGVLGVVPGIIGTLQALEAIKLITDTGENLTGRLLQFDGLTSSFREIKLKKKKNCPLCGQNN